jgi:hypothetical protein
MWTALLIVGALSMLISSALGAIATYLYFTSEKEGDVYHAGVPSIAPDEVAWNEHSI